MAGLPEGALGHGGWNRAPGYLGRASLLSLPAQDEPCRAGSCHLHEVSAGELALGHDYFSWQKVFPEELLGM
jgi:hypothetical protein